MIKKAIIISILGILFGFNSFTGPVPHAIAGVLAPEPDRSLYDAYPPFMANNPSPLVMLVMGRNHKLFYEAYNDASDLDEDGTLDITYKPDDIDYYGYFDSFKYYQYDTVARRFEPVGAAVGTNNKMVPSGGGFWSGDFLNYLTMSRMDAIRKVLYGGYRVLDTPTLTVLERAYIPQDAHSWGKEYESIARDGYDIRDYSPLPLPSATPTQTRHMFGSTSLYDPDHASYAPLLRVMPNNPHRIWEWVAKERPVVDNSLEVTGGSTWMVVPNNATAGITNMTQSFYDLANAPETFPGYPWDKASYDALIADRATPANLQGTLDPVATVDGSGNPFDSDNDNYLSVFTGTLNIPEDDTYTFSVDGDDAVELVIDMNDNGDFTDDAAVAGWYGGHGNCNCNTYSGSVDLSAGQYQFQFRHMEGGGGDNYYLRWEVETTSSQIQDLRVRVVVAEPTMPESNCRQYPDGNFKPIGMLQRYGEPQSMYFGLISGSYEFNMSGGVLRKNISTIRDEINLTTDGSFTNLVGIIKTIDRFRIVDFRYPSSSPSGNYVYGGGWVTTRAMNEGEFPDWGNPLAEMMFEAMRYYGAEGGPTSTFHDSTMDIDDDLGLPNVAWQDPYVTFPYCTKPFILSLSDIYPTYDSDEVPGSEFGGPGTMDIGGNGQSLDVSSLGDMIFSNEQTAGNRFIGSNNAVDDGACTEKAVNGFGDIRGLCPEEPTKQGSYYSASVSHYGFVNDINPVEEDQNVRTYAVGLASPLPKIDITLQGRNIRLVPFAKSVGGCLGVDGTQGEFQPTNTIVDFFVESIDSHSGRFRINYEDVEQGADHDMDAIVIYEYQLVDALGNPVTAATVDSAVAVDITLTSEYAAGCIDQHMGYIISGTTADDTYLEVRDINGSDVDYFMDTPDAAWSAGNNGLPYTHTRRFTVDPAGGATAANLLPNPLWFAAKWGSFEDQNGNDIPDIQDEWDKDLDGVPDTYFYVVNPLKLEQQLSRSFADMLSKTSSGTAAAVVANNSEGQGTMIQAFFLPTLVTPENEELTWVGHLKSMWVDQFGHLREDSNSNDSFEFDTDRIIEYGADGNGNAFVRRYITHYHYDATNQFDEECILSTGCEPNFETIQIDEIEPLFAAGEMLHHRPASDRTIFTFIDGDGDDNDGDGNVDESGEGETAKTVGAVVNPMSDAIDDAMGELVSFHVDAADKIAPFLSIKDDVSYSYLGTTGTDAAQRHQNRVANLISYIRGVDSDGLIGSPPTRNRTMEGNVWKLGDIVRSTPVNITGAVERYDIIYGDLSYLEYRRAMDDRESVVYAGANDGMLHAFTHGKYVLDSDTGVYGYKSVDATPIGEELWAYVPQSLLPHLKWLADPEYGHVFFVDSKPKLFEARIFASDSNHPGGWGTILLVGLGVGGKNIWAEGDFDYSNATADVLRQFYPTYVCMDVTDPRKPRLLWERSYDNLGMSTTYPAVVQVGATFSRSADEWQDGRWYAVIGSGPNDDIGKSDYNGYSDQNGHVLVVDLRNGDLLRDFDTGLTNTVMASGAALDKGADDGISPVAGLTYNVDAIYMGASSYSGTDWTGAMFKINTRQTNMVPEVDPSDWSLSALVASDATYTLPAITAAPSLSIDRLDNVWVMFGTGRFQEMADRITTEQNYLIGVKDPYFNEQYNSSESTTYNNRGDFYQNNTMANTLTIGDLFYSNPYESLDLTGTVNPLPGGLSRISSWDSLLEVVRNTENQSNFPDYFDGWYRELDARPSATDPSERVISKPAILSGVLFAPVYVPDDDFCGFGGSADLYGVYFETGTPFKQHVFDSATRDRGDTVLYRSGKLSKTGPPPPMVSVHIGRQKGATLFMQTGTGPIEQEGVDIEEIGNYVEYWRELETAPTVETPPTP